MAQKRVTSAEGEALLAGVLAAPHDDPPRLVYADWLEERGETEAAEYLRVQCEIAHLTDRDPRVLELSARLHELAARLDPAWVADVRRCTTPPPRVNVLEFWPELAATEKTAVRLHPRRGKVADPAASKLGGTFLWPKGEPWPVCDECGPPDEDDPEEAMLDRLVPVLQLRADDFPELAFPMGCDLFQLFWCPREDDHTASALDTVKPFVFWRDSRRVREPHSRMPKLPKPGEEPEDFVPFPCRLYSERITEHLLRGWREMDESVLARLGEVSDGKDAYDLIEENLGVCPGLKLGGHPRFVARFEVPVCECGRPMDHLLTIPDGEWNGDLPNRWCPLEDRAPAATEDPDSVHLVRRPYDANFVGTLYIFVCRQCPGWPIRADYQR